MQWFVLQVLVVTGVASAQLTLYGITGQGGAPSSLYTINTTTGVATLVGPTGFSGISSLDAVPGGGALYAIANASNHDLIRINLATGAGTLIGPTGIEMNVPDIAVRSDGVI